MKKTSVVIIDNHPIVRHGLSTALKQRDDMVVVGESKAAKSILHIIRDRKPNVAIVDSSMTDYCGVDLIPEIKSLSEDTAILIFSMHQKHELLFRAFQAGAKGYVSKADEIGDVIDAINEVRSGRTFFSNHIPPLLANQLLSGSNGKGILSSLSKREYEVAKLLSQCMSPEEVGQALYISPRTVQVHRTNIRLKLNCQSSKELLILLRDFFSH